MMYQRAGRLFLSTLSLRRATSSMEDLEPSKTHFYPRSPCGERLNIRYTTTPRPISIHALLAESDRQKQPEHQTQTYFYPRSPCGERRRVDFSFLCYIIISIHALLAESDSDPGANSRKGQQISIHALLAESDSCLSIYGFWMALFLSTLSLRRATGRIISKGTKKFNFYPRSPCGERLQ